MSTHAKLPQPCVLVAEDDDELRDLLAGSLARYGLHVVAVPNGGAALRYLEAAFKKPRDYSTPNVILSDVRMPECDGLDLLSYAALWRVPTILVTGFGSEALHREASKLGAVRCIDKPFDIVELCDTIAHQTR